MRISAKADYAVRAVIELAAAPEGANLSAREIASAQDIPQNFLENILAELRRAGIVHTHRGPGGGSSLARPADTITVGEILLAIDGPLRRGARPAAGVAGLRGAALAISRRSGARWTPASTTCSTG